MLKKQYGDPHVVQFKAWDFGDVQVTVWNFHQELSARKLLST